ncbi:endonuclease/exonuclease/phosphatase family metal-dependent hydrolase [Sediminihabitans luteus]|uniref:Endonuclease/exonuclease/phosphatase family metal-dependent hydrolase n=1 Tax=Sediminihabitans luteus TaxID=1138585 RepID=A0A2M9CD71_9CELL|nr:endonuclease/exonuclease/phosphatase family protein [Sediminihabitans luteus]PJJ69263.1 endonuclease/exonuclease/phosphatase family metal-dependent hydrolase [Sediminihabitans luteus]GII98939.1 endonuclease/exonuclease/phosphatase [Sediminihabitans luteus]
MTRLATFNVLHGARAHDGVVDLDRYQEAVASLDADVLALQEVDRGQPRSHGGDLAALAAQALGAREHRFAASRHGTAGAWTRHPTRQGPAYGIALVSRLPVLAWGEVRLPGRAPVRRAGRWRFDEPRTALTAVLDAPGGPVGVVATHLSVVRGRNERQARALARVAAALPGPRVLLGDLNRRAGDALAEWHALADVPTYPADAPRVQIDHVLADRPLRVLAARSTDTGISDHRALVVDVAWEPALP